jgi:hypothetical protein
VEPDGRFDRFAVRDQVGAGVGEAEQRLDVAQVMIMPPVVV